MKRVRGRLRGKGERREARWLVVSFVWSRLSPHLKGVGQLRAFSEQSQREEPLCVEQFEKTIDTSAAVAMRFDQATKGKGADDVDMPTFFKSKRSRGKELVAYLKNSGSVLATVDKQLARVSQAIGQ
jgi:hypothetical protein